ncbi:MAG: IS66 family transposase, partial [Treponema sp.]|nr:IS66 family transposase [Treponema sp.]
LSEEAFVKKRKAEAEPALEQFKSWLLKRAGEIPHVFCEHECSANTRSLLGTAVNYTLNQWDKIMRTKVRRIWEAVT